MVCRSSVVDEYDYQVDEGSAAGLQSIYVWRDISRPGKIFAASGWVSNGQRRRRNLPKPDAAQHERVGWGSLHPDHIHQLRVGIRRLHTALRELDGLTDAIDPAWESALVQTFRALGNSS